MSTVRRKSLGIGLALSSGLSLLLIPAGVPFGQIAVGDDTAPKAAASETATSKMTASQVPAPAKDASSGSKPAPRESGSESDSPEPVKQLFAGRVLFAQEALKARGIRVADEMKSQAVLVTASGEILPIAADWRGRAFFQDERLRNRLVEVIGYRRSGLPYLQVLTIYVVEKDGRREMDYWCDICSIPMYEIKECECCQGPIRFRLRPAKLPDYLSEKTGSRPAPSADAAQ
jgi:hypothetical protein